MDESKRRDFERLWFDGVRLRDIAHTLGVTVSICSKARVKLGLPKRCGSLPDGEDIPDPKTIRLRCAEVRTSWDFVTYKLRWQGPPTTQYAD